MGSNQIEGTTNHADVRLWKIPEGAYAVTITRKKRSGRQMTKESMANPETPFRALRYHLGLPIEKWAMILDSTVSTLSHSERGNVVPLVPLAKRMIEEARIRGITVTLDELYQHVLPLGYILDEGGMMVKEDDDKKEYRTL